VEIQQLLLTRNKFSRPGTLLKAVRGVVLHWVANPGSTAAGNRNYFENLKAQTPEAKNARYASAHYIIGLRGEIIQCLPENETGYHVGAEKYTALALERLGTYPNSCTIGIELCHTDWTGIFKKETIDTARELVIDLLSRYTLTAFDVYRHFDITNKECPLYFVRNEEAWSGFLDTVTERGRG
jgi:N-acetylmuramoyl-L-alanine amidase